jgi:hypothetical protein
MEPIEWTDPPFSTRATKRGRWERMLLELERHPGRWARLAQKSGVSLKQHAASIARRRLKGAEFEFTTRTRADRQVELYGRCTRARERDDT